MNTEQISKNIFTYRDIKFVTTEARKYYLLSEPNCHAKKEFIKTID